MVADFLSFPKMSQHSFSMLQDLLGQEAGIHLGSEKRTLAVARLQERMEKRGLTNLDDYCILLKRSCEVEERHQMVDALTTHETYFFREPQQFSHLAQQVLPTTRHRPIRLWSAASSSGEEVYSLAMTLTETIGQSGWELYGSDISDRSLEQARRGLYPTNRIDLIPNRYLKKYCRRGIGEYEGKLLIRNTLREQIHFFSHNLMNDAEALGLFDVIFLRNVLIYFDLRNRRHVLNRVVRQLKPGGYLYLGQAESLCEGLNNFDTVGRSIFRRTL